ncbi:hypothetical protein J8J14_00030 [Roseomonas sp. SSH11]|uniref:Uncharacterized protein n=1 Tax=Pararoseomonas baculiformis TaxID=2820812 RepID=A0ABS4A814_9PROT|nr:hypothetical protein [Pararoseomonas baculiformis]MBP0443151.1 hypothetical protein [Pararoseomonas baculiformis]
MPRTRFVFSPDEGTDWVWREHPYFFGFLIAPIAAVIGSVPFLLLAFHSLTPIAVGWFIKLSLLVGTPFALVVTAWLLPFALRRGAPGPLLPIVGAFSGFIVTMPLGAFLYVSGTFSGLIAGAIFWWAIGRSPTKSLL